VKLGEVNIATVELLGGQKKKSDGEWAPMETNTVFDKTKMTQGVALLGFGVEREQGDSGSGLKDSQVIGNYKEERDKNGNQTNQSVDLGGKIALILSIEFNVKLSQK
jgi:hypothetical protein